MDGVEHDPDGADRPSRWGLDAVSVYFILFHPPCYATHAASVRIRSRGMGPTLQPPYQIWKAITPAKPWPKPYASIASLMPGCKVGTPTRIFPSNTLARYCWAPSGRMCSVSTDIALLRN